MRNLGMPTFTCRQCGEVLSVPTDPDPTIRKFSEPPRTQNVVVKCPKCGTDNVFEVPGK